MKYLIVLTMSALMLLSGCHVGVSGHGHYRYRHSGWRFRHHRHHGHHHWNAGGPAYAEASKISSISILHAVLPEKIDGEFTSEQEAAMRRSWPADASNLVAQSRTSGTESRVSASVSESKPDSGYYMTLVITYIDLGDPVPNADGTPKQRGTAVGAHGVIMNAETNQMVADVKFFESSGWTGSNMFEAHMTRIGSSLANWFKDKRGE